MSGLPALRAALRPLRGSPVGRVLDVGCGYGGLAAVVGQELGTKELYGVDVDEAVISEAERKGVRAQRVDVEVDPLPFEDGSFDLVFSLGMLDYLPTFDFAIEEMRRVLRPGGHVLISIPNLGSWNNRLALLVGYQPRDVEISDRVLAGTAPRYRNDPPAGHIHTATLRAVRELMAFHGFEPVRISSGAWETRPIPRPLALLDRLMAVRPSLARRFFYLGARAGEAEGRPDRGWWRGRDAMRRRDP